MAEPAPTAQSSHAYGSAVRGRNPGDYADKHFAGHARLANGQSICLAIVADGFGEKGMAAAVAQLALDTLLETLKRASMTDIPDLLEKSFQVANKRVCEVARRQNSMPLSTTLAAAVVHNNRLYIANVGNSRIYLLRDGKILLLTVDHTVAFEQITSGRLTADQALRQSNAQQLSRSIGFDPSGVRVDLGLYLQGGGEPHDIARQQQGVELRPSDVILVCSDGLVKPGQAGQGPLASREEIHKILANNPAQVAAQILANLAAQRQAADNVTAVVLEMPGRPLPRSAIAAPPPRPAASAKEPGTAAKLKHSQRRNLLWIGLIALCLLATLAAIAIVYGFSLFRKENIATTATSLPAETTAPAELANPTSEDISSTLPPGETGAPEGASTLSAPMTTSAPLPTSSPTPLPTGRPHISSTPLPATRTPKPTQIPWCPPKPSWWPPGVPWLPCP